MESWARIEYRAPLDLTILKSRQIRSKKRGFEVKRGNEREFAEIR